MKTYATKSNAKRAAVAYYSKMVNGAPVDRNSLVVREIDGKYVAFGERDAYLFDNYGYTECPHCGIHLDNGVGAHGDEVNGNAVKHDKYEFECLACGGEFGPEIVKHENRKAPSSTTKNMTLRPKALREFANGASVIEVRDTFNITYGNAHYYFRVFKKENAAAAA